MRRTLTKRARSTSGNGGCRCVRSGDGLESSEFAAAARERAQAAGLPYWRRWPLPPGIADDIRAQHERARREYLQYRRELFGWAMLVGRKPARPAQPATGSP